MSRTVTVFTARHRSRSGVAVAALALSLSAHLLLLCWWPHGVSRNGAEAPRPVLRASIRTIPTIVERPVASVEALPGRGDGTVRARAAPRIARAPAPRSPAAPANKESAPPPGVDLGAIRESARLIARDQARTEREPATPSALLGSEVARAWNRLYRERPSGPREQMLADGSRRIRYANGTCLDIPLAPRPGQMGALGDVIIVATNCP